jgi:hypothetical protein
MVATLYPACGARASLICLSKRPECLYSSRINKYQIKNHGKEERNVRRQKRKPKYRKNPAGSSLHNLHDEYGSHIRVIHFYKQEIKYLQKRLEDVAKRNTDKDILAQVEQFQNQFILTRENLDEVEPCYQITAQGHRKRNKK